VVVVPESEETTIATVSATIRLISSSPPHKMILRIA
jgi:hypothetical protein